MTCPKCEGTTYQETWVHEGRTIHGAVTCNDCDWNEAKGQPCEACGVYVPTSDFCGNDRTDGTSEYLCPDCYVSEREDIDAVMNGECDWA